MSASTQALVTGLVELPTEIRLNVYKHLLPHRQKIDITIAHKRRGYIPGRFKNHVDDLRYAKLLFVKKVLLDEAIVFMYAENDFVSKDANSMVKLPDLLGESGVASIKKLELSMNFQMKVQRLGPWISSLSFIPEKLPGLEKFVLRTDFAYGSAPFPETVGNDRWGQERRALLSFGAFLTLRHKNLKLLIWPAGAGPTNEPGQWRVHGHVLLCSENSKPKPLGSASRYVNFGDEEKRTVKDLILDSTAIRRTSWNALDTKIPSDFALPSTAITSETPETNRNFDLVHKFSYRAARDRRDLGDRNVINSVDKMIELAVAATEHEAESQRRAARQSQWADNLRGAWRGGRGGQGGAPVQAARGIGRGRGAPVGRGVGVNGVVNAMANMNINGRGLLGRGRGNGFGRGGRGQGGRGARGKPD